MNYDANTNLLEKLLEKEEIVGTTQTQQFRLVNIDNPNLIKNLYEFIFIMLKLKFIDYKAQKINTFNISEQKELMTPEHYALYADKYYKFAKQLYVILTPYIFSREHSGGGSVSDDSVSGGGNDE